MPATKGSSKLHDFDRLLCKYVCQAICSHLPDPLPPEELASIRKAVDGKKPWHNRNGWGFSYEQYPAKQAFAHYFAHQVKPALLQDFILARGEPDMLFADEELGYLEEVFNSAPPSLLRAWRPQKSIHAKFWKAQSEIWIWSPVEAEAFVTLAESIAAQLEAESPVTFSESIATKLETESPVPFSGRITTEVGVLVTSPEGIAAQLPRARCGLHEGIGLVRNWIYHVRQHLSAEGRGNRVDLLPIPDGEQPTPSMFTAEQAGGSAAILKAIVKLRTHFTNSPSWRNLSMNKLKEMEEIKIRKDVLQKALKLMAGAGEYSGRSRPGRPRKTANPAS